MRGLLIAACALGMSAACITIPERRMPALAQAQVSNDFDTYGVRRIGLMPFEGADLNAALASALEAGFLAEIGGAGEFEIVALSTTDLDEVASSEPYRRGWYRPKTIIELTQRYRLDAILFGTVTQHRFYPPQTLGLQIDMVASETGLVIWSSSVHLDAADPRVMRGLELFYTRPEDDGDDAASGSWEVALLSPERFARFAAYQVARLL